MPEPTPRVVPEPYNPISWPVGTRTDLASNSDPITIDLAAVLDQRRSRRQFDLALSDDQLGKFLWLLGHNRTATMSEYGFPQESRPYPSGGAMHPIHILIAQKDSPWKRYLPITHQLEEIPGSTSAARTARGAASQIQPVGSGLLFLLVAEPGRTNAKYTEPSSVVWRDAGVVLGYMSILAEALGLAFCPLGLLGEEQLAIVIPDEVRLQAVGTAILGGCADS